MNKDILNTGIQDFIKNYNNTDSLSVLAKKAHFNEVSNLELLQQIEARKKCEKKLPTWFNSSNIYYPNKLNIEQTSSEETALFKSNLVSGKSLIDLSGGLGVDSYFFAKKFLEVTHVELDPELSEIVQHNKTQLGATNLLCVAADSLSYLKTHEKTYDCIYVDPSRRDSNKNRVFLLEDCEPNIPLHLDFLLSKSPQILVKTAPLFDIKKGLEELKHVKHLWVVALKNEVKELLWLIERDFIGQATLHAVNLGTEQEPFHFKLEEEQQMESDFSEPLTYLYEPNSALLKTGGFKCIGNHHRIHKLHIHSHLYTSLNLIPFPGRSFKVLETIPYHKTSLKSFKNTQVNVATRNFKLTVAEIRKKHLLKDGGALYMFFTTDLHNKAIVLVCEKI